MPSKFHLFYTKFCHTGLHAIIMSMIILSKTEGGHTKIPQIEEHLRLLPWVLRIHCTFSKHNTEYIVTYSHSIDNNPVDVVT